MDHEMYLAPKAQNCNHMSTYARQAQMPSRTGFKNGPFPVPRSVLLVLGEARLDKIARSLRLEQAAKADEEHANPERAHEQAGHDIWRDHEVCLLGLLHPHVRALGLGERHEERQDAKHTGGEDLGHCKKLDKDDLKHTQLF